MTFQQIPTCASSVADQESTRLVLEPSPEHSAGPRGQFKMVVNKCPCDLTGHLWPCPVTEGFSSRH